MGKIVIIGGGEIDNYETLPFDKRNVELTKKEHPQVLFIPTASGEHKGYIENFNKIYGEELGCKTEILYLLKNKPTEKELREKILSSDLIYVGGGNTLKMMKRWRLLGVDKILKEAYEKDIVLSGASAGGICWFESGHSDSMSFSNPEEWKYINVKGLGIIKGVHCPHFNSGTMEKGKIEKRKLRENDFKEFMENHSDMGIAIDDHCAIEFINGKYKVLSSSPNGKSFRVFKRKGKTIMEEIVKSDDYTSISSLYKK